MSNDVAIQDEVLNENLDTDLVLQKYKAAAQIANDTMALLVKECVEGKSIAALCELGDKTITEKSKNTFKKADRGVAFPTCVGVNQIVCHFSPMAEEKMALKNGDIVRIDLGVHIDGYIAVLGHTVILSEGKTISGSQADAMACAFDCMNAAGKIIRPGSTNTQLSKAFELIAGSYGVNLAEGVLSHQMLRFVIDGSQVVLQKSTVDHQVQEFHFKEYEVYAIDIVVTTGRGRFRELQFKPTIFKKHPETEYKVKLTSSRLALKEIKEKYQTLPFHLRSLDPKQGRLGMGELLTHQLVEPYRVLCETSNETVVHLKSTFFIMKNDTVNISSQHLQPFQSDKTKAIGDNKELNSIFESVATRIATTSTGSSSSTTTSSSEKKKKQQKTAATTTTTTTTATGGTHHDVVMEDKTTTPTQQQQQKPVDKMDVN
jgi:curved DNA binding protein